MDEERFDAIVAGGGLAGLTAAIVLARAGLAVLLVERGESCGAKNMTGGRLYGHSLENVLPGFAATAPVERVVKREKISILTSDASLDLGFGSGKLSDTPASASYTVLRGKFDRWLAEQAEAAGVGIVTDIRADRCIVADGRVVGIEADGEPVYGDCVILADGVNSLLAQQLGMKRELRPQQVAVGAKEVIHLGAEVIDQRFGLRGDEGLCWLAVGDPTLGGFGGGFLYTNRDTVSVGVVATLCDIGHSDVSVPQMLDRFKEHPAVAPFLEGGEPIEYGGHLVPEAGIHMTPELVRDGVLLAGDAAGFVVNLGFTVRGMDFAIESGRLAAEAVIRAHAAGDYSARQLGSYVEALKNSFVYRDLAAYKGFPALMTRRELFADLPELVNGTAERLFTVDGNSSGIVKQLLQNLGRRTSPLELLNLLTAIVEAL